MNSNIQFNQNVINSIKKFIRGVIFADDCNCLSDAEFVEIAQYINRRIKIRSIIVKCALEFRIVVLIEQYFPHVSHMEMHVKQNFIPSGIKRLEIRIRKLSLEDLLWKSETKLLVLTSQVPCSDHV